MKKNHRVGRSALAGVLLTQLAGCVSNDDHLYSGDIYSNPNVVVYRGGKRIEPGPLALNDWYAFTLLDKWRVSYAWLSGPLGIDYCKTTHLDNNGLSHNRLFEVDGKLIEEYVASGGQRYGQKGTTAGIQNFVYGIDTRNGEFKGYSPFCSHTFKDIWTGVSVLLIKPDPKHGTDRWIAGAQPVVVNGRTWLKQSDPEGRDGNSFYERWVLRIPETSYWLVMNVGGERTTANGAYGAIKNPEKLSRLLELFRQMISSVRIDPIDAPLPTLTPPRPINNGGTVKG